MRLKKRQWRVAGGEIGDSELLVCPRHPAIVYFLLLCFAENSVHQLSNWEKMF
jgi:hypothetical protein